MPSYYFDTSAALKHYHVEQGTQDVRRLVHDPAAACILSRLTLTEMQRAFARRARQREITGEGVKQLRGILYKDLQRGMAVKKLSGQEVNPHAAIASLPIRQARHIAPHAWPTRAEDLGGIVSGDTPDQ